MLRILFHPTLLHLAAIAWTITISIGCFWPSSGLPDLGSNRDKYLHVLIFVLFGLLWRLAGWSVNRVLLLGILYGGVIEIIQGSVPSIHRSGDWLDFAADALGVIVGVGLAELGIRSARSFDSRTQ